LARLPPFGSSKGPRETQCPGRSTTRIECYATESVSEDPKERKHENRKYAFDRTLGGAFGRHMGIASLGRRPGRCHFKVHRSGSKAISTIRQQGDHGESHIFIQGLHAFRRLPSVAAVRQRPAGAVGGADQDEAERLLLVQCLRMPWPSDPVSAPSAKN
jgi:hypothetical protein